MHQTTITKLESGSRPTDVGEIAALAALFGMPIAALFDSSDAAQMQLELAALASRIAALADEQITLTERQTAVDAEYESVATQYLDLADRLTAHAQARMEGRACTGEPEVYRQISEAVHKQVDEIVAELERKVEIRQKKRGT